MTARAPRLDHVNIQAADLHETVAFYRDLLGLTAIDPPSSLDASRVQWMKNDDGAAIFHITTAGSIGSISVGEGTGPVHHVALDCVDPDSMVARLDARGLTYKDNYVAEIRLKQIFVEDPNGVLLELNFRGA
jgi:catechol 2,3-dioxygenase-like lactoylglutathione lyase family enzyme